ncbi:MAG: tetratricopeptide repeat protein, partial [Gammaproteobacteria bacterium]|nr:tetratricopeptide repeat protein [Gammaproteobacteria bacterium]
MERPFPAYQGSDPYVFICYAHDDADEVYADIEWLHQQGFNVWYDEGITPGEEWNEELGRRIDGAAHVVFFVSPTSVASIHCRDEIQFAVSHERNILSVHLTPTELPLGLELRLGARQAIIKGDLSVPAYRDKLLASLSAEGRSEWRPSDSTTTVPSAPTTRRWWPAIVACGLIAVAAGAFLFIRSEPTLGGPDEVSQSESEVAGTPRIAVLPFENLGPPGDAYFAAGITDEINSRLRRVSGLEVISRKAALRYAATDKSSREIGEELNVRYLLYGSVRWAPATGSTPTRVRIAPELIRVSDETQLWADTYERVIDDIFEVQSNIAGQVIAQLDVTLLEGELDRLSARPTDNSDAYTLYLKGNYFWNLRTAANIETALNYFQRAVELDPGYALAYSGIAHVWIFRGWYSVLAPKATFPKAKAAVTKALAFDETLAEAHTSRAHIYLEFDHDWEAAEREYKRAIELNPSYSIAHHWYGGYLSAMERHDEALKQAEIARELDPLSLIINTWVGLRHYFAGRYEVAIQQYEQALELGPRFAPAHWHLGWAFEQEGRYAEAISAAERAMAISDNPLYVASLGHAHARAGNIEAAKAILDRLKKTSATRHVSAYHTAVIHGALGDLDEGFGWLELAQAEQSPWIGYMRVDPRLDPFRSD